MPGLIDASASVGELGVGPPVESVVERLVKEAVDLVGGRIRASLDVHGATGAIVARGPWLEGEPALFAARGFREAGEWLARPDFARAADALAEAGLSALARDATGLDGRARSRLLLNAPHAFGDRGR